MTLIDCRECAGRVARSAKACPHCGAPDPQKSEAGMWLQIGCDLAVAALSVVAGVAVWVAGSLLIAAVLFFVV